MPTPSAIASAKICSKACTPTPYSPTLPQELVTIRAARWSTTQASDLVSPGPGFGAPT